MSVSYNSGEQYLSGSDDYIESSFQIPISIRMNEYFFRLKELFDVLESYSKTLNKAINKYFKNFEPKLESKLGPKIAYKAILKFWELLEKRSQLIIKLAFSSSDDYHTKIEIEQEIWRKIGFQIYNETCPNMTTRQLTSWVQATPRFNRKKG